MVGLVGAEVVSVKQAIPIVMGATGSLFDRVIPRPPRAPRGSKIQIF